MILCKNTCFISISLLLSFLGGSSQNLLREDAEMVIETSDKTFFDYRLKRNPSYFFKENSPEIIGDQVYLYRSNPVISYNSQTDSVSIYPYTETFKKAYKVDLQVKPYLYTELGDYRESLRTQIAIAPRLMLGYSKLYAVFQWIFPVQNDFTRRTGFGSRPGEVGVGYTSVFNGKNFVNTFFGTFTNDRYGWYVEYIRQLFDARIYLGASFYYTGRFLYDEGTVFRELLNYTSGNIYALYRFLKPDMSIRLIAEKFLRDDQGLVLEVFRQFGNTDIGFYGARSKQGDNAGIFVAFSLGGKFFSNKWFQARLPHTFRFNYNLRPNTGIGEPTRPYTNFFYDIYRFNKHYLNNQLSN